MRIATLLSTAILCGPFLLSQDSALSQSPAPEESNPSVTFRANASLVLVDVMTRDPKSGFPVNTLQQKDFRVLDNGREVPIATFDSGAHYGTRPFVIWFVVLCNEKNNGPNGAYASGSFQGKAMLFRAPLEQLDKHDGVGVAHWCDNGDAKLDLLPTQDKDAAISVLAETLKPFDYDPPQPALRKKGELALVEMIRLIIQDAHQRHPQPLPVLWVLYGDYSDTPAGELPKALHELEENSGIVFGIKDADARNLTFKDAWVEPGALHAWAFFTGGQYFHISADLYAAALESVLLQLHFRYLLGFRPRAVDNRSHELKVEFSAEAKKQYKGVQLRYRPDYIPKTN